MFDMSMVMVTLAPNKSYCEFYYTLRATLLT